MSSSGTGGCSSRCFTVDDGLYVSAYGGGVSQADDAGFRSVATDLGTTPTPLPDGGIDQQTPETVVTEAVRCAASTWIITAYGALASGYSFPTLRQARREGATLVTTRASIDGKPEDFFVAADRCYVVTNETSADATAIRIYRATEDAWELVAETFAAALARSALRVGDDYSLGLGCDFNGFGADAGKLARLRATN